ncbi:hypothetical protein [Streptomyces sp. NBC_00102]|uniref:hypothetical protein n=1 Tax=Streptomyces sp. NBC_00102 TaxID=2975652 RepID=UPI00224DFF5E|nr:hypothetical protein [Streptomyces sp. NBC_00102]MCX5395635.1 hypothetical protein [Streptomyces sp. NBC_00102]
MPNPASRPHGSAPPYAAKEIILSSTAHALALYDMAGQVERLRFQLRTLPPPPAIPAVDAVSARVDDLVGITTAVSAQIKHCLSNLMSDAPAKAALQAYSTALAPLGEALTELGRMHTEISHYLFTAHPARRDSPLNLERARQQATEVISGCWEAADEILEVVAIELRDSASKVAPAPSRRRSEAPGRALHTTGSGLPSIPPAPASATPRAAKGR